MKLAGVIFDLDGTLVDSEGNYYASDRRFVEELGGTYDDAFRSQCVGMGSRPFCELIKHKYKLTQSVEELLEIKDRYYAETAKGNTLAFPEMVKLVKAFSVEKMPLAVASGSSLAVIEQILTDTGLRPYFSFIFSSEQVKNPKPAPDVFLHTAAAMKIAPHDCLVFEDSRHGVAAARAAGMKVVAVPTVYDEAGRSTFAQADLLFPHGMKDFSAESVLDWIDGYYCRCEDCTLYDFGICQD